MVSRDDGFGPEEPVNAQQVLRRIVGPCLGKGTDIGIRLIAEGGAEFLTCLFQRQFTVIVQSLQLIERGTHQQRHACREVGKARLERLLQQHLTVGCRTEAPHHRGTWPARSYAGCHGPLSSLVQFLVGNVLDAVHLLFADAQLFQHRLTQGLRHLVVVDVKNGAAHDDSLMEQSLCLGHAHQRADLAASARLTEHRHV